MTTVALETVRNMFNHLTQSYEADEARVILSTKYPRFQPDIDKFEVVVDIGTDSTLKQAILNKQVAKKLTKSGAKKPSKMDTARDLYNKSEDKSRKAMIEVFMSQLGLSKPAASTYFYNVKG